MKYRLELEIELRAFTDEEIAAEGMEPILDDDGKSVPYDVDDMPEREWLADAIQESLLTDDAEHLIFDGTDLFCKIVSVSCEPAADTPVESGQRVGA